MNLVNATVSPLSRASTMPQATSNAPEPVASPDKETQDCVKRHSIDQLWLRNLNRAYAE